MSWQQFLEGFRPFPSNSQLDQYKRVKLSSNFLAYAGAEDAGLGTLTAGTNLSGTDDVGTVRLWTDDGTRFMIANGAIAAQAEVYAAANGKVSATGTIKIGRCVSDAATADGD